MVDVLATNRDILAAELNVTAVIAWILDAGRISVVAFPPDAFTFRRVLKMPRALGTLAGRSAASSPEPPDPRRKCSGA